MRKVYSFLLCLIFFQVSLAQLYIRGVVKDGETNLPLAGASVYINNTTKGVTTDKNGEFQLGPVVPGRYDVVASYVGYDPLLYVAEIKGNTFLITFKLDKKETSMREVLVLTDETRRKYLEILKQNVLGYTKAAGRCKIKNLSEIQFSSGQTKDEIEAFTDSELEIENPELGYTVYFQLVQFYYNKANTQSFFVGYTRYVDWAKDDQAKKKWLKKRKEAYEGSTLHFNRSLVKKDLEKQGFSVYQLIAPKSKDDSLKGKGNVIINRDRDLKMATKITEDSMIKLYSDSDYRIYELRIRDGWRIMYAKNSDLKLELTKSMIIGGQPMKGTITGLKVRLEPVLLSEHGLLLDPLSVFAEGMWAYERLANMLPEDYETE